MKCKFCRANIENNSKICPYCDSIVIHDANVVGQKNSQTTSPQPQLVSDNFANPSQNQIIQQTQVIPTQAIPQSVNQVGQQISQESVQIVQPNPIVSIPPTPPKKKKPILLIIIILFIVGILFAGGVGVIAIGKLSNNIIEQQGDNNIVNSEKIEISENRKKSDRVIMLYVIGSNLESEGGAATKDLKEIIDSQFNQEDIDILAYVGGAKKWNNDLFNEKENAVYEITDTNITKIKNYDSKSMTLSATLTEYLNYVYANYESDKYSLILWDHGGGPIYGYGQDEVNPSKTMSILDIDKALNDSLILKDGKLEFLGFDACLMSSIEIANMFKEEANYLVASPEFEPSDGWDYSFLKEINKYTTSVQLGQHIVDYYDTFFKNKKIMSDIFGYNYNPSVSLALIDLNKVDMVNTAINNLFKDLNENISIENYSRIAYGASRATYYALDENGNTRYDLIDLYDLTNELNNYQTLILPLQQSIDAAVIYHKTNINDCYGLSMYFPATTRKTYSSLENSYEKMIVSDNYKKFLKRYTNISSGDRLVKSTISGMTPTISGSNIQAALPEDMAKNYEYADYILFRKIKNDGSFLPVLKSKDVNINNNTIVATTSNRRIAVGDANGKNAEDVIAFEISRDSTSVSYMVTGVLQRWESPDKFDTYEIEAVNIVLKVDNKTNKGTIVDIRPISDDKENVSGKVSYSLKDWNVMQFVSSSYKLLDKDGKKLDEWLKTDTMYGTEVKIKDGYTFFADSLDKNEEYYYMFRVTDTQGNLYESNLVKAK